MNAAANQPLNNFYVLLVAILLTFITGCSGGGGDNIPASLSSAKSITAFSLNGVVGTINEVEKTIVVTMPFGTDVTALVASFETTGANVAVGTATQISGTTANNFTEPVIYIVTAENACTIIYTVTVTVTVSDLPGNLTTVFSVDFNNHEVGTYTRSQLFQDWNLGGVLKSINGIDEGRVSVDLDVDGKYISVLYPVGSCGPKDSDGCGKGGGAQWLMPLDKSYDELYLSYKVKFKQGFDFVIGGKLPGLTASPDPATIMPPTGGNKPSDCEGFSARYMWKNNGKTETYLYSPRQEGTYGDDLYWKNPEGSFVFFQADRWYTITQRLVMNTPGQKDGVLDVWLDGIRVQHLEDVFYRGSECPDLGINQFYFSTFFGGNDTTWAATRDECIYFRDFIISRP
ncbi:MAG: hypothetical protein JW884_04300 [Deltaproteobacteria bacterium]|nr:hypothetical protein [Deltaproteobacteria bacterium]